MNTAHANPRPRPVRPSDLRTAADAVEALQAQRVKVLGLGHNGRKPVLQLDRKPSDLRGVITRRSPGHAGLDVVYAAPYQGVQLEWTEYLPFVQEAGHA